MVSTNYIPENGNKIVEDFIMKKFIYLILATICLALNFTSCSNDSSSSEDTYRIEMGVVSNLTYETAFYMAQSYGANITHSNIKSIRDYLYQNTTSNYDNSTRGVSIDEIRNFLIQKGFTTVEANAEIAATETLGNDIFFFEYAYSSSSKVWIYAEKE